MMSNQSLHQNKDMSNLGLIRLIRLIRDMKDVVTILRALAAHKPFSLSTLTIT